jgi:hypothetical protein
MRIRARLSSLWTLSTISDWLTSSYELGPQCEYISKIQCRVIPHLPQDGDRVSLRNINVFKLSVTAISPRFYYILYAVNSVLMETPQYHRLDYDYNMVKTGKVVTTTFVSYIFSFNSFILKISLSPF